MSRDSSIDSDLERDKEDNAEISDSDSATDDKDYVVDNTGADSLIGGSEVISRSESRKHRHANESIYDDDERSTDSDIQSLTSNADESQTKQNHRIFTFNLPFGGKNLLPTSPLSSLKTLIPGYNNSEQLFTDDKKQHESRRDIKLKLKRQETISSLEELKLFKDQKGIDNVRARAVKRVFTPGAIFHTIRSLSVDPEMTTHDGYPWARIESIWDELEGDIVILGGYRGSILRDSETGRRVWIPIRAGLNIRKVDLLIGPTDRDELDAQKSIYPDGMLTHLGPVDVAKKLIKRLRHNPRVHIEDFGYDWRLSLDITSVQLAEKLQSLYDSQKEKKGVYVIAHSMGGLIAHKVLQDHTHLIRGLIYVGAPSQCPNILGPLRFGDEVIFNKSILSAEANFFMRSSFYFLPFDGRCFVNKNTFKRYDLDFFDAEVWSEYGLSPLVDKRREIEDEQLEQSTSASDKDKDIFSLLPHVDMLRSSSKNANNEVDATEFKTPRNVCIEYLSKTLKRTRAFLESLEYDESREYPPLAIVYGNRVPTVRGAKVSSREEIKEGIYDDFYYGPGDGVVHHKWLLPEKRGFPVVAKVASECAHVSLMTDFEAIAKAFISIVEAEEVSAYSDET